MNRLSIGEINIENEIKIISAIPLRLNFDDLDSKDAGIVTFSLLCKTIDNILFIMNCNYVFEDELDSEYLEESDFYTDNIPSNFNFICSHSFSNLNNIYVDFDFKLENDEIYLLGKDETDKGIKILINNTLFGALSYLDYSIINNENPDTKLNNSIYNSCSPIKSSLITVSDTEVLEMSKMDDEYVIILKVNNNLKLLFKIEMDKEFENSKFSENMDNIICEFGKNNEDEYNYTTLSYNMISDKEYMIISAININSWDSIILLFDKNIVDELEKKLLEF